MESHRIYPEAAAKRRREAKMDSKRVWVPNSNTAEKEAAEFHAASIVGFEFWSTGSDPLAISSPSKNPFPSVSALYGLVL